MSDLLSRLFALLLLLWLPLSFFLPPALLLLAIYLFNHGWLGIVGGLVAIAFAIPTGLSVLLLEWRTLQQRPINVRGTLFVIAYNTIVFLAFTLVLN